MFQKLRLNVTHSVDIIQKLGLRMHDPFSGHYKVSEIETMHDPSSGYYNASETETKHGPSNRYYNVSETETKHGPSNGYPNPTHPSGNG